MSVGQTYGQRWRGNWPPLTSSRLTTDNSGVYGRRWWDEWCAWPPRCRKQWSRAYRRPPEHPRWACRPRRSPRHSLTPAWPLAATASGRGKTWGGAAECWRSEVGRRDWRRCSDRHCHVTTAAFVTTVHSAYITSCSAPCPKVAVGVLSR